MDHRQLGRMGLKISEIDLGAMTLAGQCDETTSVKILIEATDRGVMFLDTSEGGRKQ